MKSESEIQSDFLLHYLVWKNDFEALERALQSENTTALEKEKLDPRGRTPLMLAVKLGNFDCVKCLLAAKCNANFECDGWSVVQEAVCSGNEDVVTSLIEVRDLQRHVRRVTHVPNLLEHLLDAPDFYVEIKWEFTSWVPLMSRICPSDTYKVYKRGANVRIDTTLLEYNNGNWLRGNRSYIFKGQKFTAKMIEIDHDREEVMVEDMSNEIGDVAGIPPPPGAVKARMNAPVTINNIDMEKISFERNKTGIWGWRSDKNENINGYECKVYGASNVEFITKSRTEHLREEQLRARSSRTPLHNFLGLAEDDYLPISDEAAAIVDSPMEEPDHEEYPVDPKNGITAEEYFSEDFDLAERDIGRPKKTVSKVQRFKANLWLSEEYPINLQEQVLPILDLMSTMASPHVQKLKDFITMQLPSGFPVRIEIPLFHVLNACITFGNVFALTTPVTNVSTIEEDDRITCIVDDRCFDIPTNYRVRGAEMRRQLTLEDEDDLLQLAIEQSLVETGNDPNGSNDKVDIWEALRGLNEGDETRPQNGNAGCSLNILSAEDAQLQR
ncbi:ANKRD13D family protein [Megaselia abdita]